MMMRANVLAVVLSLVSAFASAADESVWLHCNVATDELYEDQSRRSIEDEHLFITVDAKDDSPGRLIIRIWSDHGIGTEGYTSWSEGTSPDAVISNVTSHGWTATAKRSLPDGVVLYREISIDRRTGAISEFFAKTKNGAQRSGVSRKGLCRKTKKWVDL